jgi:hypothetical protein
LGRKLLYRLAMLALAALGVFFIAFPERTTDVAHLLGVGRGTDLLLYLAIVTGAFAVMVLYARLRRLERQLTDIAREGAIRDARGAGEPH